MRASTKRPKGNWRLPSVSELARDRGWIGQALSTLPGWLLQEADRWGEFNVGCQENRNDPNRLHFPDPWQFLLDAPAVPPLIKKVCRGAQSQLIAFRRLARLATGVATSITDWQQEALKASGDKRRSDHAASKVAAALWRFEPCQKDVQRYVEGSPAQVTQAEVWQKLRRGQLIHRGKRSEAEETKALPRWSEIQRRFSIETRLTLSWVRLRPDRPDGPHGFMFWRNEALSKLVPVLRRGARTNLKNLGRDYIKNLRQNLGLIPVNDAACLIWDVDLSLLSTGEWRVKGYERNRALAFRGIFPSWNKH